VRLGENHIGVAVGQDGRQVAGLVPVRNQERAAVGVRIVKHPGGSAQPARRRDHFLFQISQHVRTAPGHPALSREGDPPGEIRQKGTRVEIISRIGDSKRRVTNPADHPG
jgi:hypothetical protein